MLRAAIARASTLGAARTLAASLAVVLLVTEVVPPLPADARGHGRQVAAIRHRQARAEDAMRRADSQIRRLGVRRSERHRRYMKAGRRVHRAERRLERARARLERTRATLRAARSERERTLHVRPDPRGRQVTAQSSARTRRLARLERRQSRHERATDRARRAVARARRVQAGWAGRGGGRSRIAARKRDRQHAEAVLSRQITLMLALAKARAGASAVSAGRSGFSRPARGRISQRYGCQARRGKGRGGRCVRSHDGIDIAARRGTRVHASASGVVAYTGWSPWDRGRRAYVVIIGHARGYETIYAHLKPQRRVRAGQRVHRGQVIGVIGLTGRTSGAHVHWEVSKGFRTRNPLRAGR